MNNHDQIAIIVDLDHCQLNHGPDKEKHRAVEVIVQKFGFRNGVEEKAIHEITIPVCLDCLKSWQNPRWTVIYCFSCCSSQWVDKKYSKMSYRHKILWLKGCPDCTGVFGGLYFSDPERVVDGIHFLSEIKETR